MSPSDQIKILSIVCDLEKGGTQRAAQNFAIGYKELGHDSRILALNGLGSRYEHISDILIVYKGLQGLLLEIDKNWIPDLIHIHSHLLSFNDVKKILSLFRKGGAKVVETNVFSTPSPWIKDLDISFQLSNWGQWLYHLRQGGRSAVLSNPVNLNCFIAGSPQEIDLLKSEYQIPKEAFLMGRIGESYDAKWSTLLIDAFEEVASKNLLIYLLLVNPPESIEARCLRSPLSNRIKIIGEIKGDKRLSIAYSAMDVMVHISGIGESFGYVLPEAVLSGTPVITMSTPWADNSQGEILRAIGGGYVVNRYSTLISVLEGIIAGKRHWKISAVEIKKFKNNYGYLELSRRVIDVSFDVNNGAIKNGAVKKKDFFKMIDESEDKCSMLFKIIFLINRDFAFKMGPFISGFIPLKFFPKKFLNTVKVNLKI